MTSTAEVRPEDVTLALAWLRRYSPLLAQLVESYPYEQEALVAALLAGLAARGSGFVYLVPSGTYYAEVEGTVLLPSQLRAELDRALDQADREARGTTESLRERLVDLVTWESELRTSIKLGTLAVWALAVGGARRLTLPHLAAAQGEIEEQYGFLRRFAEQVQSGQQPLDGRAMVRTGGYMQSLRGRFMQARAEAYQAVGYDERRNVIYAGDSCEGCLAMDALGWLPIDDPRWIPVGERDCLYNCRCDEIFRKSATGERSDVGDGKAFVGPVRRRRYEENPKHGSAQRGKASPRPVNGQEALDYSVEVKPNVRVAVEEETGRFVVFRNHRSGYHGYTVEWGDLRQDQKNALIRAKMVDSRGRIR